MRRNKNRGWYYIIDAYGYVGPFQNREECFQAALAAKSPWGRRKEFIDISFGENDSIQLSDWIEFDIDMLIERATDLLYESDRPLYLDSLEEHIIFKTTKKQDKDLVLMLRKTVADWQAKHNLSFQPNTLSKVIKTEEINLTEYRKSRPYVSNAPSED